jgi:DNA-binding MarR family transcriptional regulator
MTRARGTEPRPPQEPASNPALESDFGWALRMLASAFSRTAAGAVADLPGGARGYLVLVALSAGEPPSQLALAQQVSLDRTVMTYLLDDLEAQHLITRSPDPRDRRVRHVVITDEGRTFLHRTRQRIKEAEQHLLSDLDQQEASQMRELLTRVALTAQREDLGPTTNC